MLIESLLEQGLMDADQAESLALALTDIAESVDAVFGHIVPRLLTMLRAHQLENAKEALWDLREAFHQIDYHVHDANLTDL